MVVVKEIEERFEEYQEDKNFAPKQNERDCPMTVYYRAKAFIQF